jgi:uncharacterized membrane protein
MEIESTYYTILGVPKEANESEIKKAFVTQRLLFFLLGHLLASVFYSAPYLRVI